MKIGNVHSALQLAAIKAQHKVRGALEAPEDITTFRRAFVYGMALALVSSTMDNAALAGPTIATEIANPMDNISKFICSVGQWLRGPIGLGIVILMVVVAGVGFATGGKKSTGVILGALGGAAIIFGARAIAGMVTSTGGGAQVGECGG